MQEATQPLAGVLVAELAWYLPIAFAGQELVRLGARVVRIEPPDGDPLRRTAPAWDRALARGKESVVCDLRADPSLALAICSRADVVLEGLRPGVADRLGIGADDLPLSVVHCSITGFGHDGRHAQRVGHDLNYLGWAGVLEDTPTWPPVQIADLGAIPAAFYFAEDQSQLPFRGFSLHADGGSFLTAIFRAKAQIYLMKDFDRTVRLADRWWRRAP